MALDPATITQIVTALGIIAKIFDTLGPGGIVLLFLAGPVVVVVAVLLLSHFNNRRLTVVVDAYRKDADDRFDKFRSDSDRRFEEFRSWMTSTVDKYGEALSEVSQFYKDNVELVRTTQKLAQDHVDVISFNTRIMQKLADKIESNQFCPMVKKEMRP
ncbi:hypothetical protein [uncultured Pseudodesulfovibrio sp.]|uniref:hypothetical protein n=1 Tax=uncultured Pseudodesulfovibrio sp. TaxID=2035858 RepID=UPI0029C6F206|nr:hypothetical protein [uncultured Pseudodesulfovibrio sp.]